MVLLLLTYLIYYHYSLYQKREMKNNWLVFYNAKYVRIKLIQIGYLMWYFCLGAVSNFVR